VTTVEMTAKRPSALASACAPATKLWPATVVQAQVNVLGQTAVEIQVRTTPTFGVDAVTGTSVKINYMGYTSAMGEGKADATLANLAVSVLRDHQVQDAKASGGNARGIPPRGRPV